MKNATPYAALGQHLANLRIARNWDQPTFAKAVGYSQQTISRWEAGRSRPKPDTMAVIAEVFNIRDQAAFFKLAEEVVEARPAVQSFDQPFPMDQLNPETFERFIAYLLGLLHRDANVMRAGTTGHKQDGLDILVTFPDGGMHSFQCKRVMQFGPAEVRRAIKQHTAKADKKHLVLSRVASPQTTEIVRSVKGWELWDKESISQLIRTRLAQDDQIRLVDIFFQGQREALLGLPEASAWMTLEEFYAPLSQRENPFNHTWQMQGRNREVAELEAALKSTTRSVVAVAGAAGMGKSRLLKEVLERAQNNSPVTDVRFLSTAADLTRQKLDLLGKRPKILVVDDAHDRDKLSILLEYAAANRTDTHVILATRPYAEARILREAAVYGIGDIPIVRLNRLSKTELLDLVKEALNSEGAQEGWAEPIAAVARDSPLVAVMAARIVVRERISPEMAKNDAYLRHFILGKFKNVLAGELGSRGDQKLVLSVLDILALVQPFHIEDPNLIDLLRLMTDGNGVEISRVLSLLVTGGVLFKRGPQYRLMPDILGDYLIEESCVDHNGRLSAFAQTVLKEIPPSLLTNTLVNLGRMDWRRSDGDPASSNLLDAMWQTLHDTSEQYDPRLEAVRAVAVFQPHQALKFVEERIRRGAPLPEAAKIVRNVAYNPLYVEKACECLWNMGRNDSRELGSHVDHPIRVLSEMCSFDAGRRLELIEPVFEFGMKLIDRADAWKGAYSPLDILKPVLSCEGVTTEFRGRSFVMSPYMVNFDVVAPLRKKLIDRIVSLLADPDPKIAARAAKFLQHAIQGPRGAMGARVPEELDEKFSDEAVITLHAVTSKMKSQDLHPAAYIGIASSVAWMARHREGKLAAAAQAVLDAQPGSLEFRIQAAMADGYGRVFIDMSDAANWQSNVRRWMEELVAEVRKAYPNASKRLLFVTRCLEELERGIASVDTSLTLLTALLHDDVEYARVVVAGAIDSLNSVAGLCLANALHELYRHSPSEARLHIGRLIEGNDGGLAKLATRALGGETPARTNDDVLLLRRAFSSADPQIVQEALSVAMSWRSADPRELIQMAKKVRLDLYPKLAHWFGMMLSGLDDRLLRALTRDDVVHLLKQMGRLPSLDDYWMQELVAHISFHYPHELADFFFERVELASSPSTFSEIRPANHGPFSHKSMRFMESGEAGAILAKAWAWLRKNEDRDFYFQHHAADLFDAMFITSNGNTVSNEMVSLFESRIETASPIELKLMARILRHADNNFVFSRRNFVVRLMNRCGEADPDDLNIVLGELHASTVSGVRTSNVGEPAPQDLETLSAAKQALTEVPRLSPAFELYDLIRRSAESHITRSKADGEALDHEF